MDFKIITDSTANLSQRFYEENEISVVTLFYNLNGIVYPAYAPDNPSHYKDFYRKMRQKPKVSTSCANETQYYEEFEKAIKMGLPVLYVGFSNGVSASYNCAENARKQILKDFPSAEIYCVDTLTGSLGQGHFVKLAVEKRREGLSAKQICEFIFAERMNLSTYVTVDDLYFLYQGGRIPSITYHIGSLIKIKPIIKITEEGKLTSYSKVLSRKRSIKEMFNIIKQKLVASENSTVYVAHADCEDDAKALADLIKTNLGVQVEIDFLEPVIGSHTGAGAIAVFFNSNGR